MFSKSSRTRNKKLLGISPLTLLCTTWAIVALNLFACRQMNEVNGACSPAHNKTNDGSGIYSIIGIDADKKAILYPPTVSVLSFAHINVNSFDVEGRID